ncbi:MAG: sensor histidine kinase [Actinomycetota bacterium]
MRARLRTALAEPAVADPPRRVRRDRVLLVAILLAAVLEVTFREDVPNRWVSFAFTLLASTTVLFRRTRPLAAIVVAFGFVTIGDVVMGLVGREQIELYSMAFFLLLPYALTRWASGRDALLGLLVVDLAWLADIVFQYPGLGDAIGGAVFLMFPAALGAIVRLESRSRERELDEVRFRERAQLARELHDTVAHHVSAIAIQAQAGRTVAATRPDAAIDVLGTIEEEASRTLAEMRSMVSALRNDDDPELAPQLGVAAIERLAQTTTSRADVTVELAGDLDQLRPSLDAGIYRLAQESITNAIRHARDASRIDVHVNGLRHVIRLTVSDDGASTGFDGPNGGGYGLVGMAERAKLLGGTFDAGPRPGGGWIVSAVLPRETVPR